MMKYYLNHWDGRYRVDEYGCIEVKGGQAYYDGKPCQVGDKFVVPVKDLFIKGRVCSVQTVLCRCGDEWFFKGLEVYGTASQMLSRPK